MRLVCLAIALAVACPAFAQKRATRETKEAAPAVKKFDFDNDVVEAGATLPQLELIGGVRKGPRESLIRVRTTFVPELIESARQR
jgi:hypothetical protein